MESHTTSVVPMVSIILPTYNRAHLVGETIDSILKQSYTHFELIIIDDGSTDDTEALINRITDHRILYTKLNHTGNLGVVRNAGLAQASGELIAFADSDDLWRYDKLTIQVKLLQEHTQADFIISDGEVFGEITPTPIQHEIFFKGSLVWPILQEKRFVFYTPSWIFWRRALESVGMINETLNGGSEFDFFLRMCATSQGIFTNERLVKIRRHAGNLTADPSIGINRYSNMMKTVQRLHDANHLTVHQYRLLMSNYHYKVGLFHKSNGDYKLATSTFITCIKFTPLLWKAWIRLASVGFRRYI